MNAEFTDGDEEPEEEEEPGRLSKKQQAILWRRSKVMEMHMTGFTMTAIADHLKVSLSLVSKDIQSIKEQSQQQLQSIVKNEIPLQWAKARSALQFIQRESLQVFKGASTDTSKLAALSLFETAQLKEFELIVNSAALTDVMKFIENNTNVISKHNSESKEENNTSRR